MALYTLDTLVRTRVLVLRRLLTCGHGRGMEQGAILRVGEYVELVSFPPGICGQT